jgi:hypothetical protein
LSDSRFPDDTGAPSSSSPVRFDRWMRDQKSVHTSPRRRHRPCAYSSGTMAANVAHWAAIMLPHAMGPRPKAVFSGVLARRRLWEG